MKRFFFASCGAVLAATFAVSASAQALKFSTVGRPNDPDTAAMNAWADYIEANSDLEVDVFAAPRWSSRGARARRSAAVRSTRPTCRRPGSPSRFPPGAFWRPRIC